MTDNFAMPDDVAKPKDSVGGGGFLTQPGVYDATIKHAYRDESFGNVYMNVELETSEGKTLRQSLKILGKDYKTGKPVPYQTFGDKKTQLKGYTVANSLGLLGAGKGMANLALTKKTINKYDFDQGKELPTEVDMYMDLVNKPITVGIKLIHKNKITKEGDDWITHKDRKEVNEIDAVFHPKTGLTTVEVIAKLTDPVFKAAWADKNTGVITDKYDPTKGTVGTAHTEVAEPANGGAASPTEEVDDMFA